MEERYHREAEQEDHWDKVHSFAEHFHNDLEGHCYHIVGEGSGTYYREHFEKVHTEQDYFVEDRYTGQGLAVHFQTKDCVVVHIEEALGGNYSVGHMELEAGHIVEDPAGNLLVGRTAEDILEGYCKKLRCRMMDFEAVHMVVEGPVNSH